LECSVAQESSLFNYTIDQKNKKGPMSKTYKKAGALSSRRQTPGERVLSGRGDEKKHSKILLTRKNFFPIFGGRTPFLKGSEHGTKQAEGECSNERSE
jgi:hypothetical protein